MSENPVHQRAGEPTASRVNAEACARNPFEDDALGGAYISGFKDAAALSSQRAGEPSPATEYEAERAYEVLREEGLSFLDPWDKIGSHTREAMLAALDAARQPKGEQ